MSKRILFSIAVMVAMIHLAEFSLAAKRQMVEMGLVTGGPKGTYYQFGLNLEELAKKHGFKLRVDNSNGSVENIYAVFKRPRTQLGIVQSDVLAFVAKVQADPVLKKIAQKIKLVYPLYNEEVHLVGTEDIPDFDNLEGRRVAIGKEGSGTYLTSKLLFEVSGVQPAELVAVGGLEALEELKNGNVDAMFYVAGYPVKLFSEQVTKEDGLAILPITNKSILEFYSGKPIPAETYDWQNERVQSVTVKAVLVSFDFRMSNCENVGRFAQTMAGNIEWLRENGHPKWNSVDLDFQLKGWEQYDCVKKFQVKRKVRPTQKESINPVLEAIKDIL